MGDDAERGPPAKAPQRFLGSLRDALAAAGREDHTKTPAAATPVAEVPPAAAQLPPPLPKKGETHTMAARPEPPSAAEAARAARGGTPNIPPADRHVEVDAAPTTRVVRNAQVPGASGVQGGSAGAARTQLVRGKQKIARHQFHQDPVVGFLVIVGGPGLGSNRPIYEGNNTVGRSPNQRIPLDFGDDAISSEEQAYVRYDSAERTFLFVPNLSKTNVVAINDKRPTAAVILQAMDVIIMGRTQLVFVPFCGPEFDWSVISDNKD